MVNVNNMVYDDMREWIEKARSNGVSWDAIRYANEGSEDGLIEFLQMQTKSNFWPSIKTDIWYEIVSSKKMIEEEALEAKEASKGASLVSQDLDNSFKIPSSSRSSWQLYKSNLLSKGFNQVGVKLIEDSAISILKRLSSDTKGKDPIKGLVVGNVQSGKTANMAGLMAMAADHGFNMFIVLSGLVENLRKQTQERLFFDLNHRGNITWTALSNVKKRSAPGEALSDFHFEDGNKPMLYVCLKNKKRLESLLDWLQKDPNKYANLKVLIIDDEADQGSINTGDIEQAAINSEERKAINKLIVNLVNGQDKHGNKQYRKPKAINYISYTATPYANFLNEYAEESLYPRDFIMTLSTPLEYFGPKEIFGVEGDENYEGIDIVREISDEDLSKTDQLQKSTSDKMPESLKESVAWFLCSVSSLRHQGYKKPLTLMVHTSQKQDHHENIARAIKSWLETEERETLLETCKRIWNRETVRFNKEILKETLPSYSGDYDAMYEFKPFHAIEALILQLIEEVTHIPLGDDGELTYHEHIHLCVDNCSNNGTSGDGMYVRLAYPNDENRPDYATAFIVVGGTTLSRGLTIEGLISTYFSRETKQADTLMQMGRWFGYRKKYEIYPRIWMPDKNKKRFEFLATLEYELRDTLEQYSHGADPSKYGPRVKNTPSVSFMRVTAKNRSQAAQEVDIDFTGSRIQTILFDDDKAIQKNNIDATEGFIKSLGEGESPKNKIIWRDVQFDVISKYLKDMNFNQNVRLFNEQQIGPFIQWIRSKSEELKLDNWNVIVSGNEPKEKDPESIWDVPGNKSIGKVNRSAKSREKNAVNIGVLRDPADLYADINPDEVSEETREKLLKGGLKSTDVDEVRYEAGLQDTPLLIIYRINKHSQAKRKGKESKPTGREDLNTSEDLIGLCVNIPGVGSRGDSYGGLRIVISSDEKEEGVDL